MMVFSKSVYPELWMLAEAYVEGRATPEQISELEARIDEDPQAMHFLVAWLDQHAALQWQMRDGIVRDPPHRDQAAESKPLLGFLGDDTKGFLGGVFPTSLGFGPVVLVSAFSLILLLGTLAWFRREASEGPAFAPREANMARISRHWDAEWTSSGRAALALGERLDLEQGLLEIRYATGARLLLEGPTEFTVTGANAGRLERGRLTALVPPPASGFAVDTPRLRVVDVGTEFGVGVDASGATELAVFQGKVRAKPVETGGRARHLREGAVFRLDSRGKPLPPVALADLHFVRTPPEEGQKTLLPASEANARLADIDGDEKGDRVYRPKKHVMMLSIGEGQVQERLGREGRYWIPFPLSQANRNRIEQSASVELRVHLVTIRGAQGYRVDVLGIPDRKSLDVDPSAYEARGVLLAKGIFRHGSKTGENYTVDVTEFVRAEAAKPDVEVVAFRLQVVPEDLPRENATPDCFVVVPAGKNPDLTPTLIVTEGDRL